MPGDAEEGIGLGVLPLVLSLAPCGGAGCCPRPPLPWHWGRSAPLLFLVFARLFLRAPFVSKPAPARSTPLSLASCCRLAVVVAFRRSASRIPPFRSRRSLRKVIISRTYFGCCIFVQLVRNLNRTPTNKLYAGKPCMILAQWTHKSSPRLLGVDADVSPSVIKTSNYGG